MRKNFIASFAAKRRKSFCLSWCSGRDAVRFVCQGHFSVSVRQQYLSIQHRMDTAITKAAVLERNPPHSFLNGSIISPNATISHTRQIHSEDCKRPEAGWIMLFAYVSYRMPFAPGDTIFLTRHPSKWLVQHRLGE